MSKSLGNVIVPNDVMKQLGADILRLWVASVDYQADVRVSQDILRQVSEAYRKIRNTFRFLLGNLHDFDPKAHRLEPTDLTGVDLFMLVKLNDCIEQVKKAYDAYEFSTVYHTIHNFCTIDLSSFYMDMAKDTLYIEHANHPARRAIQTVMYESLIALTKLISPILTHTAEEVWEHIPGMTEESVQLTDMPKVQTFHDVAQLKETWNHFMNVRDDVLKALEQARDEKVIGKSLAASLTLYCSGAVRDLLTNIPALEKLFIVSKVTIAGEVDEAPEEAIAFDNLAIVVAEAEGETCDRCWVVTPTVGEVEAHPTICTSCANIVMTYYEKE